MSTPTDKTPTPVTCRSCGYSGLIDTYDPCLSVYADCRCPQCGSTDNQHNDDYNDSLQADVEESHRRPQTMSAPTPRTDAVVAPYVGQDGVSVEECDRLLDHARQLERELEEARHQMATFGIVELAIRNPNVSSYIAHWEGRTLKAESQLTAHKAALVKANKLLHDFEAAQRPHGSDRFGNACECEHCQVWDQLDEALTDINEVLNDGPLPAPNKEQSNHK